MNELTQKLTELAAELSPKHLLFANGVLSGKSQEQAYIDAGYSEKGARQHASRLVTNGNVKNYLDAAKRLAQESAQEAAEFTEGEWMATQRNILQMSLGEVPIQKVITTEAGSVSLELEETNLPQANKSMELIARRYGWLTDNKNVKQAETVTFQIDLS